MIEIIVRSNLSGRIVKSSYTARRLVEKDEDQIIEEMTICDCQPIGETSFTECNCSDEWDDYTMIVGNENNYNNLIKDRKEETGVTWIEAFKAGLEGKKIKVYGQYLTYPKFETLHYALNYLSIRPTYYQDMLKKEWYIEQD